MYTDRIDLTLPEANLEQIVSFLLSAEDLLSSLKSVTPTERKHLAKLGLKNETLARDIIEVGRANLDLIPRGIDFQKIDRDLIARDQLRSLKFLLERLLGKVKDSLLLTGVDLYAAALAIYHSLRRNGDYGSLKDVVDELKKGFARPSRKKKGEAEETAAINPAPQAMDFPSPMPTELPPSSPLPSQEPQRIESAGMEMKTKRPIRKVIRLHQWKPIGNSERALRDCLPASAPSTSAHVSQAERDDYLSLQRHRRQFPEMGAAAGSHGCRACTA